MVEAYWEVPGGESTATNGQWVKGPGAEPFSVVQSELGELPIIAENLGVITPEVEAIRNQFNYPGMAILQFAFGETIRRDQASVRTTMNVISLPTGTRTTTTPTAGWWSSKGAGDSIRTADDVLKEHAFARSYLGLKDGEIHWASIRAILASVANTAIIPLQDVLGLGSKARMNLPGTSSGNWRWRARPGRTNR